MLALQWSMSQFTPTLADAHPGSVMERYYAAGATALASFLLALLLLNLMVAATESAAARKNRNEIMAGTHEYLDGCGARPALQRRFLTWLSAQTPPTNCSLHPPGAEQLPGWVSARLPKDIRTELDKLVREPAVVGHPLFKMLQNAYIEAARGIYMRLEESTLAPGEVLYSAGKFGSRAHIVVSGRLRYDRVSGLTEPANLVAGKWLGEAALWFQVWARRGRAYACSAGWTPCHIVALPAAQLQELLLEPVHREAHAEVAAYARAYGRYAAEQRETWLSDLTDPADSDAIFKASQARAEAEAEAAGDAAEPVCVEAAAADVGAGV